MRQLHGVDRHCCASSGTLVPVPDRWTRWAVANEQLSGDASTLERANIPGLGTGGCRSAAFLRRHQTTHGDMREKAIAQSGSVPGVISTGDRSWGLWL